MNAKLNDLLADSHQKIRIGNDLAPDEFFARTQRLLEEVVERRTRDLLAHQKELERFNSAISHDLRAPLRRITQFSEMLMETVSDKLTEREMGFLRRVIDSSNLMDQLVESLLSLSEHTMKEMNYEEVDLAVAGKMILGELREAEPQRNVEIEVCDLMLVQGDRVLLRNMLQNLLGNAWKYSGKNAQAKIEFGTTITDEGQAFFVRDNGAGFDMKYSDRLFTPLQRLHADGEFSGKGIGLATVQRIIHRHGGKIWAEGEPGKGATFYFTL